MTPAIIQKLFQIRREFFTALSAALSNEIGLPVNVIQGSSSTGSPSRASWTDNQQRLNYVCLYAHMAPDALVSARPFILRIGVNKGLGLEITKYGRGSQRFNQGLQFELTLLPEETFDVLPWLISVLKADDECSTAIPSLPRLLNGDTAKAVLSQGAWTHSANRRFSQTFTALRA